MRCEEQGRLALRPRFYGPSLTCWSGGGLGARRRRSAQRRLRAAPAVTERLTPLPVQG